MKISLSKYTKAIAAAASSFYAAYTFATQAGSPGGDNITAHEWQGMAISALIIGILVWAVPNSTPTPPAVSSGDDEATGIPAAGAGRPAV